MQFAQQHVFPHHLAGTHQHSQQHIASQHFISSSITPPSSFAQFHLNQQAKQLSSHSSLSGGLFSGAVRWVPHHFTFHSLTIHFHHFTHLFPRSHIFTQHRSILQHQPPTPQASGCVSLLQPSPTHRGCHSCQISSQLFLNLSIGPSSSNIIHSSITAPSLLFKLLQSPPHAGPILT